MQITGNKLTASEGMTLTNGDAFGKVVYLAAGADASAWREVTDEEAERLRRDLLEAEEADYRAALTEMGVGIYAE